MSEERPALIDGLKWIGHDSFRIDVPFVIYIDPWRLPVDSPPADLILVSHEHQDHCSPDDVARIRTEDTIVIANPTAASKLVPSVRVINAGDSMDVNGVMVEAIPAYNLDKPFHPKEAGHVGYILTIGGERLYFAGDTDHIPEMEQVRCDVALLPVSGVYVMTAEEAAESARTIQPKVAIPMHYGAGVAGTLEDAQRFKELSPVPVIILVGEEAE
ncbi:MAG: MBL fold metallo-hydrolase [Anaerolineales bacterium]|nr:MBL fold metallo-hydrolase [Anaerolineales bacterium]